MTETPPKTPGDSSEWAKAVEKLNTAELKRLRKNLTERHRTKMQRMGADNRLGFGPDWKEIRDWFGAEYTVRAAAINANVGRVLRVADVNSTEVLRTTRAMMDAEFDVLDQEAQQLFARRRGGVPDWYYSKLKEERQDALEEAFQLLRLDLEQKARSLNQAGLASANADERLFNSVKVAVEARMVRANRGIEKGLVDKLDHMSAIIAPGRTWDAHRVFQIFADSLNDVGDALKTRTRLCCKNLRLSPLRKSSSTASDCTSAQWPIPQFSILLML
jgi:hypothetical protein